MAKQILYINDDFADLVTKFNALSDDVGDLTLLTDSANDVVTAINYRDSDFTSINAAIDNVLAISNAADSDQNVVIDGKTDIGHTHLEADITDLDKYTQAEVDAAILGATPNWTSITGKPSSFTPSAHTHVKADITDFAHTHVEADITNLDKYSKSQVNALLADKEPADATILKDADIGVNVQPFDATTLTSAAIGVTVQAYDANTLKTSAIGVSVQPYNAQTALRNVNNNFSFRQVIESNPGVASTYTSGQLELKAPGAQDVTLGFNRNGNTGAQLRHEGNGLILSGNTRTASADLVITGDFSIQSDRRTKKGIIATKHGLETVCKLRGVDYIKSDTDTRHTGFIAQEVLQALPEAVNTEGEYLSVSDRPIVAALVEAVKDLARQVEELKRGN